MIFNFRHFGDLRIDLTDSIKKIYEDTSDLLPYVADIYNSTARYNLISGGRASTKTSLAGALHTIKKSFNPIYADSFILCTRTYATNLETTTFSTIKRVIISEGLADYFEYLPSKKWIVNKVTNVIFTFKGLQNPTAVKSTDNISFWWHDEAEDLPINTIEIIAPTVRGDTVNQDKYRSKIIFTYNPLRPVDDVAEYCHRNFKDCDFKHINIYDLPPKYQNREMLAEAERDRESDDLLWKWKWLGQPHPIMANEPFSKMKTAKAEKSHTFNMGDAFLDPSYLGGDTTALSIAKANGNGGICVIGYAWKLAWNLCSSDIVKLCNYYNVPKLMYESNNLGDEIAGHYARNHKMKAQGFYTSDNKKDRIYKSAYFIDRVTFLEDDTIANKNYMNQMKKYNSKSSTNHVKYGHDDAPDSFALLLQNKGWI